MGESNFLSTVNVAVVPEAVVALGVLVETKSDFGIIKSTH
jgi:hypothetical protein